MTNLTNKEIKVLNVFIDECVANNGAASAQEQIDDNFSYASASDIQKALGWDYQTIGGVMSSLEEKRLISNTGENARNARNTDWICTDAGAIAGWPHRNQEKAPRYSDVVSAPSNWQL